MAEKAGIPLGQWLVLVGAVLLMLHVCTRSPSERAPAMSEQQRADERLRADACAAAQTAVKERLRAPSTAKFPGCVFGAHEYRIGMDDTRENIKVFGHVDAENGFGATIRSQFGVQFENSGGQLTVVKAEVMN